MRLGAQAVELAEGTRAREVYGEPVVHERHRHRYEVNNELPRAARRQAARRLRHVPGRPARGDRRAPRPPVVRREPVPPRVQVAADPAGAALPRVRRCRARARAHPLGRPRRLLVADRAREPRPEVGFARVEQPADHVPLLDLFLELCAIPSPSGQRARRRRPRLRLPDDARARVGRGRRGGPARRRHGKHLLPHSRRRADGGTPIFLCAHTDTVPPEAAIEPVVGRTAIVRNAGGHDPRLGQQGRGRRDARGGAARRRGGRAARRNRAPVHAAGGGRPARRRGLRPHAVASRRTGYVYDQGAPIGEIVLGSPSTQDCSTSASTGARAHAGMYPEDGRSAIAAASRAIADFRLGRIDEETSANVGVISGGTARNVVPEWCSFTAEVRSHDEREGDRARARDARERPRSPPASATARSRREVRPSFPGYRFRESDAPVRLAADGAASEPATRRPTRSPAAAPTRTSSTRAACSASISRTG